MGFVPPRIVPPGGYQPIQQPDPEEAFPLKYRSPTKRRDQAEQLKEEHPSTLHPEMSLYDPTLNPPQGGSALGRIIPNGYGSYVSEERILPPSLSGSCVFASHVRRIGEE